MKFPRTQAIALANQKGGCGKTSSAVNLSAGLALEGYRTCLVDLDSQCNASMTFGVDPEEYRRSKKPTVLDAFINKKPANQIAMPVAGDKGEARFDGNLSIVPGHPALSALHQQLEASLRMEALTQQLSPEEEDDHRRDHRERLGRSLDSLQADFDFIIVDTPPELGFLLSSALRCCSWFIIPVFPSEYDLNGLQRLIASAKKIRERNNPTLRLLSVLVGNYDRSTLLDQQIYDRLSAKFGGHMSKVRVPRGVKMRESTSHHMTIFEHAPSSDQAEQFRIFSREVVERIQKSLSEAPAPGGQHEKPVAMATATEPDEFSMGEGGNG